MSNSRYAPSGKEVEILFPIEAPELKEEMGHILATLLADTEKAHLLTAAGTYEKVDKRGKELLDSQLELGRRATELGRGRKGAAHSRVFTPMGIGG